MDYVAPFDLTTFTVTYGEVGFADWTNGNRTTGEKGSRPPKEALTHPITEIVAAIKAAGLDPTEADLVQLAQATLLTAIPVDGWTATPPGAPSEGARYIVGAGATGDWAAQDEKIAAYINGDWAFIVPRAGAVATFVHSGNSVSVYYDGANWKLLGGNRMRIRTLTTSGSYAKPAYLKQALVIAVGGGGGGGGGQTGAGGQGGAGGGGGGAAVKLYDADDLDASEAYVIGAGGTGGGTGTNGTAGGDTTFKGLTGGGGSEGRSSSQIAAAYTGGTATGGDLNVRGGNGHHGLGQDAGSAADDSIGGMGGSAGYIGCAGGGEVGEEFATTGKAGTGFGSGGGGGAGSASNPRSGGAGAAGVVMIREYF